MYFVVAGLCISPRTAIQLVISDPVFTLAEGVGGNYLVMSGSSFSHVISWNGIQTYSQPEQGFDIHDALCF
jgi:hypothetical protein